MFTTNNMNVSHIILMHLYKFILIKNRHYWYMIGIWNTKIIYQNLINFIYPFTNNMWISLQDFYLFCVGLRTSTKATVDSAYLSRVWQQNIPNILLLCNVSTCLTIYSCCCFCFNIFLPNCILFCFLNYIIQYIQLCTFYW